MAAGNSKKVVGWTNPIPSQVAKNAGSILTTKSEDVVEELLPGTNNQVLKIVNGLPAWGAASAGSTPVVGTLTAYLEVVSGSLVGSTSVATPTFGMTQNTMLQSGASVLIADTTTTLRYQLTNLSTKTAGGTFFLLIEKIGSTDRVMVQNGYFPLEADSSVTLEFTEIGSVSSGSSIEVVDGDIVLAAGAYRWTITHTGLLVD